MLYIQLTLVIETYLRYYPVSTTAIEKLPLQSDAKGLRQSIIFHQLKWKLESFIFAFRAERFHPHSINRSARKFHLYTTIGRPCIGDKKLEGLILIFRARRFYFCSSIDMLNSFIFVLLLEAKNEERKDVRARLSYN